MRSCRYFGRVGCSSLVARLDSLIQMCILRYVQEHKEERMERKLPVDWLKDARFGYCIKIFYPDGWDRKDFEEDWHKPLTEDEMHGKVMRSTIEYDNTWISPQMIPCVKIFPEGQEGCAYIQPVSDRLCLDGFFDGAEIGEEYIMKLSKMTQGALDALPEFDGF